MPAAVPSRGQVVSGMRGQGAPWYARYRGTDGKERSEGFDRKADGERFLHHQEVRKARREWVDPALAEQPFAQYVEDWWATTTHLRPSSRSRTEGILRHHLLPRFGDHPLSAIQPNDVRAFVAELVATGLAPATVRKVYNVLGAIFGSAATATITPKPAGTRGGATVRMSSPPWASA